MSEDRIQVSGPFLESRIQYPIIKAIIEERRAQDLQHETDRNFMPLRWLAVLNRVLGKFGSAVLADDKKKVKRKLIQLAAVAVAALEVEAVSEKEEATLRELAAGFGGDEEEEEDTPLCSVHGCENTAIFVGMNGIGKCRDHFGFPGLSATLVDNENENENETEKPKCIDCETTKDVTLAPCPFAEDINDDPTPVYLCGNCRDERSGGR